MSVPANKVSVGPTTIAGSTVTLTAFALAVVGFAQGARDEETFSALAVGGVSLLTVLGGRFGQAIAQALSYGTGLAPASLPAVKDPMPGAVYEWNPSSAATTTVPRPSVSVSHGSEPVVDDLGHGEG